MKRKVMIMPILLALVMMLSGLTVFAKTPVVFKDDFLNADMSAEDALNAAPNYKGKYSYFRDEAEVLTNETIRKNIYNEIEKKAAELNINIVVYLGGYVRDDSDAFSFLIDCTNYLFAESTLPYVILYIDMDDDDEDSDCCLKHDMNSLDNDALAASVREKLNEPLELCQEDIESAVHYYLEQVEIAYHGNNASSDSDIAELPHEGQSRNMTIDQALEASPHYRSEKAYFCDEAELFDEKTRKEIFDRVEETSKSIGMGVAVYIGGYSRSNSYTREFLGVALEKLFGTGDGDDSVGVYLDFEGGYAGSAHDFIDTYRDAYFWYPELGEDDTSSKNRVERMLDDMYAYLPSSGSTIYKSDVKNAIDSFLDDLVTYKEAGIVNGLHYQVAESGKWRFTQFGNIYESPIYYNYFFIFLLISLIVGIFTFVLFGSSIRKKYMFRESYSVSGYTSRNRIRLNNTQDIFVREYTTKHKIESSSGGGGGHGGGGGGGHSSSHHGGGRSR